MKHFVFICSALIVSALAYYYSDQPSLDLRPFQLFYLLMLTYIASLPLSWMLESPEESEQDGDIELIETEHHACPECDKSAWIEVGLQTNSIQCRTCDKYLILVKE